MFFCLKSFGRKANYFNGVAKPFYLFIFLLLNFIFFILFVCAVGVSEIFTPSVKRLTGY